MANQVTEAPEPGRSSQPECREKWEPPSAWSLPPSQAVTPWKGRGQKADPEDRAPLTEGLVNCRWEL